MQTIRNYIGGGFSGPVSGEFLDVFEPATGRVYVRVPESDQRDVDQAVAAAEKAFTDWSHTPAEERARVMLRIADLLESRLEQFARAESIDTGKPVKLARTLDIPRAIQNVRFFATSILHFHSESHVTGSSAINYTLRQPRGVAGLISPWNLPLYLFTWKIAPAIAVGNTAVAKPSELTPMTAYLFGELCQEASLPSGVLNVVHGSGAQAGAAIVGHPKIGTLSFTGGTRTGADIAQRAAPMFKKVSLEMGGKNPNIVFDDADLDEAVDGSVRAAFANQGQLCLSGSRVFVQRNVYPEFVERFTAGTEALKVGDPLEETTDQGSLISKAHLEKVRSYVELAKQEGGIVRSGGRPIANVSERCRDGYFFEPTVLTDLDVYCRTNQEEIFGPVVAIIPFDDERQVIDYANSTQYGLSASVWTRDLSRAHRLAERINSGTVWINCWLLRDLRVPFGGMKNSGLGREGGEEALRFFTEPKNVCINVPSDE
ncbi:MAG: aldehyde dehydrogenase [Candidatus Krumholzibacteria bacterium]